MPKHSLPPRRNAIPALPPCRDKLMREAYAADVALWDQYLLDKLSALLISLNTWVPTGGLMDGPGVG